MKDIIIKELFGSKDEKYRDFQSKLIPTVEKETIIGVRTPKLREFAKQLIKNNGYEEFIKDLPHRYFEENQLHAFILSELNDFDRCVFEIDLFLPYIDNWATCDQLSPRSFKKRRHDLLSHVEKWLGSDKTFAVRFGIGVLMRHFLDEDFDLVYPEKVAKIRSEEYYVNMMIAWYFATALFKQYDSVLPFIKNGRLDEWTHNTAIKKALESFRITPDKKEYLKTLKIRR